MQDPADPLGGRVVLPCATVSVNRYSNAGQEKSLATKRLDPLGMRIWIMIPDKPPTRPAEVVTGGGRNLKK